MIRRINSNATKIKIKMSRVGREGSDEWLTNAISRINRIFLKLVVTNSNLIQSNKLYILKLQCSTATFWCKWCYREIFLRVRFFRNFFPIYFSYRAALELSSIETRFVSSMIGHTNTNATYRKTIVAKLILTPLPSLLWNKRLLSKQLCNNRLHIFFS